MTNSSSVEKGWWREYNLRHQPAYASSKELRSMGRPTVAEVTKRLRDTSGIVSQTNTDELWGELKEVFEGSRLCLIAGDCAETFFENTRLAVSKKQDVLKAMSDVMAEESGLPVTYIGRMAGQYSKPRSQAMETRQGSTLPSYLGDGINDQAFTKEARIPDPGRMWQMYQQSLLTHGWLKSEPHNQNAFIGHEALLLEYEDALVRECAEGWYSSSANFLWVGDRTRYLGSAHIEFLKNLRNPLGIKVGPNTSATELVEIIRYLNPENLGGRVTLMLRLGREHFSDLAANLVDAVLDASLSVVWMVDPMHGNTRRNDNGDKIRVIEDIEEETKAFCSLMSARNIRGAGLHLEVSGSVVGEILSIKDIESGTIPNQSLVDPRLDPAQAVDLARLFSSQLSHHV